MEKKQINIIDIMALCFTIILIIIIYFVIFQQATITGKPMTITVKIASNTDTIYPVAAKLGDVYFDSLNTQAKVVAVSYNHPNDLEITLSGNGSIEGNKYIYDGVRVLIGQEAEIHGSYFAQGVISAVQYKN